MNLLFHTPGHAAHDPPAVSPGHPERPARLDAVAPVLDAAAAHGWTRRAHRPAADEALLRLHPAGYLAELDRVAAAGGGRVEADTVLTPGSIAAVRAAAGAGLAAVDAVLTEPRRHGPPSGVLRGPAAGAPRGAVPDGLPGGAMGFCLLANAALAAEHARAAHGLSRVLVVDFDVHHGNGTQDAFYDDGGVHFLSLHRFPFYPGSGAKDETGTGPGLGATRNLPTPFGTPADTVVGAFRAALGKVADACRPELVVLSAGFDARRGDPVGDLGAGTGPLRRDDRGGRRGRGGRTPAGGSSACWKAGTTRFSWRRASRFIWTRWPNPCAGQHERTGGTDTPPRPIGRFRPVAESSGVTFGPNRVEWV